MTHDMIMRKTTRNDYLYRVSVIVFVVALLSACSNSLPQISSKEFSQSHDSISSNFDDQRALKRALTYWSKEYSKDPKNATSAYNYANNLILAGKVDLAFKVLQDAIKHNPKDEKLISEYGRLALRMNKVSLAQKVLNKFDGTEITDWRALSARGALLARSGKHLKAQKDFKAALKLSPDEPSVLNNLALSYALNGQPKEAEKLLQQLVKNKKADKKIVNNLALVLGLQGKFNQAENVARESMPVRLVKSNMDYLRRMVKKTAETGKKTAPKSKSNNVSETPSL